MNEDLQFVIIVVTLLLTIISVLLTAWRLDVAKKQYKVTCEMLKESRKYWNARLKRDKQERRRT